jgi:hypothetical protein
VQIFSEDEAVFKPQKKPTKAPASEDLEMSADNEEEWGVKLACCHGAWRRHITTPAHSSHSKRTTGMERV